MPGRCALALVCHCLALLCLAPSWLLAQDVNEADELAMKAAMEKVAPSIVKITTSGGQAVIGGAGGQQSAVRKGTGPTTGLVVGSDGWIITSSFNFANNPSDIIVTVPGRARKFAKIVSVDTTRMLTLLKIDETNLPVPEAFPVGEIRVGQWALALGRALDPDADGLPSLSIGIISAKGRIFGKCLQTDAKVSPVNYGGPLVALDGRVFGLLVPASPRGETETAGVEWYDSGIGFAVPWQDVLRVLPKMQAGETLRRGLLGIAAKVQDDNYNPPPIIGSVSRESAAEKAGIKPEDQIVSIDGQHIANFSAVQHALGPKYAGDRITVKVLRDGEELEFRDIELTSAVSSFQQPFLGIVPLRDVAEAGVVVRYVYPNSAAAKANLEPGDRILSISLAKPPKAPNLPPGFRPRVPKFTRDVFIQQMTAFRSGDEVKLSVKKLADEKPTEVILTLGILPEDYIPESLPMPASEQAAFQANEGKPAELNDAPPDNANDAKPEVETGLIRRENRTLGRESWLYVPPNYNKKVSYGVIIWLHRAKGSIKDGEDLKAIFGPWCERHHYILVGPRSKNEAGWLPSETEEVIQELKAVLAPYNIDRQRIVAHGMAVGGQMAFYLAFQARDFIRAVAVTGATLGTQVKEPVPGQPISFFIVGGEQDPLIEEIASAKPRLAEKKYPVIYRQIKEFGKEYLLESTLAELKLWLDSLDRI